MILTIYPRIKLRLSNKVIDVSGYRTWMEHSSRIHSELTNIQQCISPLYFPFEIIYFFTIWFRPYLILILSFWEHWFCFILLCSPLLAVLPVHSPFSFFFHSQLWKASQEGNIVKTLRCTPSLLTSSLSPSLPSFLLLCCSAQALCCHWGCCFFAESLLCIQPGTMEYSQCVYFFFVPGQNAGCFFVLVPSAKEFRRWETEGEKEGGMGRTANKAFPIPQRNVLKHLQHGFTQCSPLCCPCS